jgi:hypothetical protein
LALLRSLIILVGLTMTWFSEKMMISYICISGFMPNSHKKSWMVSNESILTFIYSEKATKFCKISTLLLTVCTVVKSNIWTLKDLHKKNILGQPALSAFCLLCLSSYIWFMGHFGRATCTVHLISARPARKETSVL